MTTRVDRKRRSSAEVKQLIADAASAEFVECGFERATIRSVAHRAGVTESMVFRHFESKAELFRSTAAAPLVKFMNDFAGTLDDEPGQDSREVTLEFARGLYQLCSDNRHILVSLAASAGEHEDRSQPSPLAPCLQALMDGVHRYMERTGTTVVGDVRAAIRLTVALVLGTALARDALFPPATGTDEISSALAQFILCGSGYSPAAEEASAGSG
ncbi:TetR family transcriptional regulator [Actinomadura sp. LD22]|uniref:TetR family transcriptional regulator n=1 Tax=Actinomadura physcomitrii TaxID=2650748 RepID=A0A6I4MGL8_9ACTN|nr:TetR/AcrR family transcriptional regulator [Actinomadura physcomitrii]MWA04863.1 TetR family transcriptional regulator [Actinomadura physcomitrii]